MGIVSYSIRDRQSTGRYGVKVRSYTVVLVSGPDTCVHSFYDAMIERAKQVTGAPGDLPPYSRTWLYDIEDYVAQPRCSGKTSDELIADRQEDRAADDEGDPGIEDEPLRPQPSDAAGSAAMAENEDLQGLNTIWGLVLDLRLICPTWDSDVGGLFEMALNASTLIQDLFLRKLPALVAISTGDYTCCQRSRGWNLAVRAASRWPKHVRNRLASFFQKETVPKEGRFLRSTRRTASFAEMTRASFWNGCSSP